MKHLELCKDHKQERNQSCFDPSNCDYCKLEAKLAELETENKRLSAFAARMRPYIAASFVQGIEAALERIEPTERSEGEEGCQ